MVNHLPSQAINKERGEIYKVLKQAFFREEEKTNQTKKKHKFFLKSSAQDQQQLSTALAEEREQGLFRATGNPPNCSLTAHVYDPNAVWRHAAAPVFSLRYLKTSLLYEKETQDSS